MGVNAEFSKSDIAAAVESSANNLRNAVVRRLSYIGEKAVNRARANGNYKDQTGNLRSSIQYAVSVNGKLATGVTANVVKNGEQGVQDAKSFARSVAKTYPNRVALIIVAGMEYAKNVYDKGYDVITSGRLSAEKDVNDYLKNLKNSL